MGISGINLKRFWELEHLNLRHNRGIQCLPASDARELTCFDLQKAEIVKNTINRGYFVFHFFTLGHLVKPVLNTFLGRNLKTIYYW